MSADDRPYRSCSEEEYGLNTNANLGWTLVRLAGSIVVPGGSSFTRICAELISWDWSLHYSYCQLHFTIDHLAFFIVEKSIHEELSGLEWSLLIPWLCLFRYSNPVKPNDT